MLLTGHHPFYDELDEIAPKCQGKPEYTEYKSRQGYDADEAHLPDQPSMAAAVIMCLGCPLFNSCEAFAQETKPEYGVWAGQVRTRYRNIRRNKV